MASRRDRTSEALLKALDGAATLFSQGGEARLPAMFHALRVATEHLRRIGANDEQLAPLSALLHAIDRLNHGQKVPVLAPRKGFSAIAPDRDRGVFVVQQAIALVVEEVVYRALGGKRGYRRPAQKAAAEILARHGFRSRVGRPITENVLRQWRSDMATSGEEFAQLRQCVAPLMAQTAIRRPDFA